MIADNLRSDERLDAHSGIVLAGGRKTRRLAEIGEPGVGIAVQDKGFQALAFSADLSRSGIGFARPQCGQYRRKYALWFWRQPQPGVAL